jgi:hemoglobin
VIVCFDHALADVILADGRLGWVMHEYFAFATTTLMLRYHHSGSHPVLRTRVVVRRTRDW